ncbi:unnamed protein product [Caenorhabditis sp. 36 PRJEB53466]|nr:unnamed protein product [Caenorhabditis sp. 36 PRJEB53466]
MACGWVWLYSWLDWLQLILEMESFCKVHNSTVPQANIPELNKVKESFTIIQVFCCILGVLGNILNLRTLQSPSLQTVPFMYIRSLAIFDLIALTMILLHFFLVSTTKASYIMYYTTYIEAPVINTFLIAGLYCAFLLTMERHFLISRPHNKSMTSNPRALARRKIHLMLLLSFGIHLPMVLQRTLEQNENGDYVMVNNVNLLCKEPNWTIYSYYKLARECLRFCVVFLMTFFNVIIAHQLQVTKQRRRRLVRRSSPQNEGTIDLKSEPSMSSYSMRKEDSILMRSFTEKKLTVLMITICIIFLLGNVPQIIVMILQNEAMENNFNFQLYRHISNTLEVLNHCLNFYVFCIASSEYTRAFLLNCMCLQRFLFRFPSIASMMVTSSTAFGVANKEYLSMESIPEEAKQWVVDPSSSPYAQAETNLKSILVTGNKETRQKKSLTIVNHRAIEVEEDSEHEIEIL